MYLAVELYTKIIAMIRYFFGQRDKMSWRGVLLLIAIMLCYVTSASGDIILLFGLTCLTSRAFRQNLLKITESQVATILCLWSLWIMLQLVLNYGHWSVILKEIKCFIWPFIITRLSLRSDDKDLLFVLLCVSVLVADLYAVLPNHWGSKIPGHAVILSWINAIYIILCWHLRTYKKVTWFYDVASSMMLIYILFINTRRSGVFVLGVLLLYFLYVHHKDLLRLKTFWLLLASVAASLLLFTKIGARFLIISHQVQMFMTDLNVATSVGGRLAFYPGVLDVLQHNPIFGVGLGGFGEYFYATDIGVALINTQGMLAHPHNSYLTVFYEQGLVGLSLFLYMFRALWRLDYSDKVAAHIVLIAFMAGCLVDCFWSSPFTRHSLFILLFVFLQQKKSKQSLPDAQSNH